MPFVLDGILLIILLLCTITGVRRGLVRSAAYFLGAIFAIFLASWLGGILSTWVYDSFFRPGLYERILTAAQGKTGPETIAALFENMPDFLLRFLEMNGITQSSLVLNAGGAAAELATAVTDALSPVFIAVIKFFAVIILFILLMIVIKAIASLLSGICRLPVLSQLNSLLGGVFGLLFSAVVIWLALSLVTFLSPMLAEDWQSFVETTVQGSMVTKFVVSINPFSWLFA